MTWQRRICPNCGKRTIVRKKQMNGKYSFVCKVCGIKLGEFKLNKEIDVV